MTTNDPRALFETWLQLANEGGDLPSAVGALMALDCVVHSQNTDDGGPAITAEQLMWARSFLPDMALDLRDVWFPGDLLVVQFDQSGTISSTMPFGWAGRKVQGPGMIVARVRDDRVVELWSYMNFVYGLMFPPTGVTLPVPSTPPGDEQTARAVYAEWLRRAEERDFLSAVVETMASGGVVHLQNADVGDSALLGEQFAVVFSAFTDLMLEVEEVVVHGDRLLVQFTMGGVHSGKLGIYEPTGLHLRSRGAFVARTDVEGRVSQLWPYIAPMMALNFPPKNG